MPSHIEILSPSGIEIKNFELNEILNELVIKLHKYDEIAKNLMIERGILAKQIEELKQDSGVVKNDKAIKKIKKNKKPKKKQKKK